MARLTRNVEVTVVVDRNQPRPQQGADRAVDVSEGECFCGTTVANPIIDDGPVFRAIVGAALTADLFEESRLCSGDHDPIVANRGGAVVALEQ
jgi:hypothetical protein